MPQRESPRTFYLVMRLHQLVADRMEDALMPIGITASQYTVLSILSRYPPMSSAELSRRLRISAQSTGESVKALEAKALIRRYNVEENKRVLVLELTAQGHRVLARANRLVAELEDGFFAILTSSERHGLEATIAKLRVAAIAVR